MTVKKICDRLEINESLLCSLLDTTNLENRKQEIELLYYICKGFSEIPNEAMLTFLQEPFKCLNNSTIMSYILIPRGIEEVIRNEKEIIREFCDHIEFVYYVPELDMIITETSSDVRFVYDLVSYELFKSVLIGEL